MREILRTHLARVIALVMGGAAILIGVAIALPQGADEGRARTLSLQGQPAVLEIGGAVQSVARGFELEPALVAGHLARGLEHFGKSSLERKLMAQRELARRTIVDRVFGEPTSVDLSRGVLALGRDGHPITIPGGTLNLALARLRSVALLATVDALEGEASPYPLKTSSLAEREKLCPPDLEPYPYRDQAVVLASERCSASVVKGDVLWLLTARHCVPKFPSVNGLVAIFDYAVPADKAIMRPQKPEIVALSGEARGSADYGGPGTRNDWALLPLPASWAPGARLVLELNDEPLAASDRLYTVHHPLGLPVKFTPDGIQLPVSSPGQLFAAIDIFSGSSGAPVFSTASGKLIGIVQASAGATVDFGLQDGQVPCRVVSQCSFEQIPECEPVVLGRVGRDLLSTTHG